MARLEDPRGRLELELDRRRHARLERLRRGVPVAVREVEHAAAHERRRAVGKDVAEPRREERHGVRRGDREAEPWMPEQLELVLERPVVGQRARVVLALVVRQRPGRLPGARDPRCRADVAAHGDAVALVTLRARRVGRRRSAGQVGSDRHSPRISATIGRRPRRAADEHRDRRLLVDPVPLVPEPAAEPADQLGDEVDVRPGDRRRRRHVRPRADDHAPRTRRAPRRRAARCSCTRRPSRRRSSSGTRSGRIRAAATRGASTARRPAPRASGAATARCRRFGAATPRASRRRRRQARAGGRCTPPCRCTQSTRSIALRTPPM